MNPLKVYFASTTNLFEPNFFQKRGILWSHLFSTNMVSPGYIELQGDRKIARYVKNSIYKIFSFA